MTEPQRIADTLLKDKMYTILPTEGKYLRDVIKILAIDNKSIYQIKKTIFLNSKNK